MQKQENINKSIFENEKLKKIIKTAKKRIMFYKKMKVDKLDMYVEYLFDT
jgi:hypothetical protein